MTEIDELVVRIRADTTRLERELKRAGAIASAEGQKINRGMGGALRAIKGEAITASGAITGLAGALGTKKILDYSDAWASIQNRLKLVTDSSQELEQVTQRLFDISQDTRSSLDATAALYQRLTFATKGLGVTQGEVLKFTEQLNKQLLVGGLSSTEAATSIFQLTQAFNKGKLDGDEFRTILESAPPILEALQRSLGKTRGEILEMSAAGKLGPRELIQSINDMAKVTDKRFADLSLTMSQAFTLVDNAYTNFIGQSDDVSAVAGTVAQSLQLLAENMDVAGRATLALAAVMTTRLVVGIGASLALMNPYIAALSAVIGGLTFAATATSDYQKQQVVLNRGLQAANEISAQLEQNNRKLADSTKENTEQLREENSLLKQNATDRLNSLKAIVAEREARLALFNKESTAAAKKSRGQRLDISKAFSLDAAAEADEKAARELQAIAKAYEEIRRLEKAIDGGTGQKPASGGSPSTPPITPESTRKQVDANKELAGSNAEITESQKAILVAMEETARFQQVLKDKLSGTLTDIAFKADSASDAFRGLAESIARAAFERQIAGPLADSLIGTDGKPGFIGAAASSLGSYFGGILGFAEGGNPPIGKPSIVGERGPEIFVPKTAGTVIPNDKIGMGGVTVYQTISLNPGATEQTVAQLRNLVPAIKNETMTAVFSAMKQGGSASKITGLRN